MEEKILKALANPSKAGDVAAAIGEDKAEVAKVIKKLVKDGKVTSPKMCFYQAVK